jgi:hypothetical protein
MIFWDKSFVFLGKQEGVPPTDLSLQTKGFTQPVYETKKETKKIKKITHKLLAID